jgi:hypothetical protein
MVVIVVPALVAAREHVITCKLVKAVPVIITECVACEVVELLITAQLLPPSVE